MRHAMLAAALAFAGCGDDDGDSGGGAQAPDFLLVDQNPATPTFQASVSPRDYLEKVPGFYFTHAG